MAGVGLVICSGKEEGGGRRRRVFGATDGLWMKGCGCGSRKSKPGPAKNEDIHVGQRKQDYRCSLRTVLRAE